MQTRRQDRHLVPVDRILREELSRLLGDLSRCPALSTFRFRLSPKAQQLAIATPGAKFI